MSKTLVLVEDTRDLLSNLAEFLSMEGYYVHSCISAKAALETLKTVVPDVIITDLSMPEMDGFQFIEEVRQLTALKKVPIIIFSARPMQENAPRAMGLGVAKYIKKPCSPTEFLIAVQEILID